MLSLERNYPSRSALIRSAEQIHPLRRTYEQHAQPCQGGGCDQNRSPETIDHKANPAGRNLTKVHVTTRP